jgi:transposase-like protein
LKGEKLMKNKKYTNEFKEKVVKEYLSGKRRIDITNQYEINKSQVAYWTKQWREFGCFPDGRGKAKIGRPKVTTINTDEMTKDEYIAYLEMELKIAKHIAFLEKRKTK